MHLSDLNSCVQKSERCQPPSLDTEWTRRRSVVILLESFCFNSQNNTELYKSPKDSNKFSDNLTFSEASDVCFFRPEKSEGFQLSFQSTLSQSTSCFWMDPSAFCTSNMSLPVIWTSKYFSVRLSWYHEWPPTRHHLLDCDQNVSQEWEVKCGLNENISRLKMPFTLVC